VIRILADQILRKMAYRYLEGAISADSRSMRTRSGQFLLGPVHVVTLSTEREGSLERTMPLC
jgi:hypothetical protein